MDWRRIAFDWNRARAFLVTAEEGSLSAAARATGQSQPTVGRQVEALEHELGVQLFDRTGRGLVLTPSGLALLEHVRGMGRSATDFARAASGQAQSLEGDVAISAGEAIAAWRLPPILANFHAEEPGIRIEVVATNAISDLTRREADIAIRHVRPGHGDLIARKVAEQRGFFYATPEYLRSIGSPATLTDLEGAKFIGFGQPQGLIGLMAGLGVTLTEGNFAFTSESHIAGWELVRQGLGIGVMSDDIAAGFPDVTVAVPGMAPIPVPIWLTAHREVNAAPRIRRVFDYLADALG